MSQIEIEAFPPPYHPAKPLPFELAQHAAIFFEEKLYTQALNLLLNVLASNCDTSTSLFTPSPQHLALASTFLVHPSTTARPKTVEEEEAPNVSLRLLRLVNTLVGPIAAQFSTAFSFTHFESSRQGRRRHAVDDSTATESSSNRDRQPVNVGREIPLDLANSASVWSRAEDFWHAAGWAFNCSVLHPFRWEPWRIWLEFMCQILEDDWHERKRHFDQDPSSNSQILRDSLIIQYIDRSSGGSARNRRILRAIFADGGASAVTEFREVFHHELQQSRNRKNKKNDDLSASSNSKNSTSLKKREMEVNIDEDKFGDYLTSDHDDDDDSSTPNTNSMKKTNNPEPEAKRPRRSGRIKKPPTSDQNSHDSDKNNHNFTPSTATATGALLGDMASLSLRQRLLQLLSTVSETEPKLFIPLDDLYYLFVENICPLPLPIYQAFVSPFTLPYFSAEAQTTLCELLLFRLRESAAPCTTDEYLTQEKLQLCFLPYAAASSSLVENAKMSIALESLLILLHDSDLLRVTPELIKATDEGINKRSRRIQSARRPENLEWSWLIESGDRLKFLLEEVFLQA